MRLRIVVIAVFAAFWTHPAAAAPPADLPRTLVIAITSQLGGSLTTRILDPEGAPGGLLHLAPLVQRLRAQTPGMILLDAGDALTGAPDALPIDLDAPGKQARSSAAPPILGALRALRYDAAVPGGRDLPWVDSSLSAAPGPALPWAAANLRQARAVGRDLPAFRVIERAGLRLGVMGLVAPGGGLNTEASGARTFQIADAASSAGALAARLRHEEHADLVIALGAGSASPETDRETGLLEGRPLPNAAAQIADSVSGVDLVIAGRGRFARRGDAPRPNRSYRVPLIEPVPSPRALTVLRVEVARDAGRWTIVTVAQETLWAESTQDAELAAPLASALAQARAWLSSPLPVYVVKPPTKAVYLACAGALGQRAVERLSPGREGASPRTGAIGPSEPLPESATLSLLPALWMQPRLTQADRGRRLTRADLQRWIAHNDALVRAELTGRQVALLLEPYVRHEHAWRTPASGLLYPGGLIVDLAPQRSEANAVRLAAVGQEVGRRTSYWVWMTRYHRSGGGGTAARALIGAGQPLSETPITYRGAVRALLEDARAPLPGSCDGFLSREPPAPRAARPRRARIR